MLKGCTRTCKKSCRRGARNSLSNSWEILRWCDSHMASCRHMFTTKSNLEKESGIGCKVSFLSELQDSSISHPLSSEHLLRVCLQIVFSFSCISFCDFAVENCSFGMHSGGTTGRRKETTGRGGGCAGIRGVWASNWQPVTTTDWPHVKDS